MPKSNKSGTSSKVHVKFSSEQLKLIRSLKGPMGDTDSEVVRAICVAWMSEKGVMDEALRGGKK
jgi:hypothetical protein